MGVRAPELGNYRVSAWDATTRKVLDSTRVKILNGGGLVYKSITPILLEANKNYFITMYSAKKYYLVTATAGGPINYPITTGSVKALGYGFETSPEFPIAFPTGNPFNYISGIMDFDFQPD